MKRIEEAYNYQKTVIETLEEIYKDEVNHPDFPVAYSVYSFILRDMGNIDGALSYQEKATRIREDNNENDPKLAINYNNLGMFNLEKGDFTNADFWQKKAIEMDLKNRGPNHIDLATDYFNYAKILEALNNPSEAIRYLKMSRNIEVKNNSHSHNIEEIDELICKIENELK